MINKVIKLDSKLFDLCRHDKINLNNIEILFSYKNLKNYIKLVIGSDSDEFNEIIISEFIIPELNEFNELTELNINW